MIKVELIMKTPAPVGRRPGARPNLDERFDMSDRICSVPECTSPSEKRGWCNMHYRRWKRTGDPERLIRQRNDGECSVDGCSTSSRRAGMCGKHYQRVGKYGTVELPPVPSDEERFWARVTQGRSMDCWEWQGTINPVSRYGQIRWSNGSYAHRLSHELFIGPIPDGYQVDHLCRNRRCVNPAHLEAVTPQVNNLRSESPAAHHARKTSCPQGHPYDLENTRHYRGSRYCKTCDRRRPREAL